MKVDIEKVQRAKEYLRSINRQELKDLELYEYGKRIKVSKRQIKEWEVIGLNNTDFIDDRIWEVL